MASPKLQAKLPKGMRDFLPEQMLKRNYVFSIVRSTFHHFGFEPLHTPVLEMRDNLVGNYGGDAEKLIFYAQHPQGKEELALRYDLTIPLARVIAQHFNDIQLPFKRYQLAPVWRADRPQRGRYREFYQCDADIVGSRDMSADAEVLSLAYTVLTRLGFDNFVIKVNNRKLLNGMGVYAGIPDSQLGDLYRSIDKYDKVGADGVEKELAARGIANEVITRMMNLIHGDLQYAASTMQDIPEAHEGIGELMNLEEQLQALGVPDTRYHVDFTMVRGLGYYTGPIFETVIEEPNLGSIMGGGRYDGLIGRFRKESYPTTGISLGIERIIDLMDTLDLYPPNITKTVAEVFVTVFDEDYRAASSQFATTLRQAGICTELALDIRKIGKQFNHADKKGIPIVAVIGSQEFETQQVKLKRLHDGHEITIAQSNAVSTIQDLLSS